VFAYWRSEAFVGISGSRQVRSLWSWPLAAKGPALIDDSGAHTRPGVVRPCPGGWRLPVAPMRRWERHFLLRAERPRESPIYAGMCSHVTAYAPADFCICS
jgi:hypothetical protein